jgi:hypothetical protein
VDLGAEFLHGSSTVVNDFLRQVGAMPPSLCAALYEVLKGSGVGRRSLGGMEAPRQHL